LPKRSPTGLPTPTNAELEILGVLWNLGPSTVRDVHESLGRRDEVGYTTILKLLQNMHDKGLVMRQASQRSHVYSPAYKRTDIVRNVTKGFVDRVFSGSRSQLVLHALREESFSAEEITDIQRALDKLKTKER
jgi:BlaI family transcriptional regulator, penicillinase repressor